MSRIKLLSVVYAIAVLVSIYWAWQLNLNVSDWLTIVGTWIFGAVLMFELFDFISKSRERKLRHSRDLVKEVFEIGISENGHVDYKDDKIVPFYIKWVETNPMFPYVVQHLKDKEYKKIWQAYEKGKQHAEAIINEVVKKIQQYREMVEQNLLEAEMPIPVSQEFIDHQTRHYNLPFLKYLVFTDIKHILKDGKKYNDLKVSPRTPPNLSSLSWGVTTFAIAEEGTLKNLQNVIEKLENDEIVITIIKDVNSLETRLKDNKELEQFDRGREEIVRQVKYGQKPLRGKCALCS